MKPGDKVILLGFIDGCSYETTGQTNFIIALETGERVEVPIECVIKKEQVVKKDEIKLKDVIRRINRLDENSKTYWLDTILNWFSLDFGLTKYRQGYEKGKLEGEWVGNQLKDADKIRQELNKPVIPQFVADWIEVCKEHLTHSLYTAMTPNFMKENGQSLDLILWIKKASNQDIFARAWLDGYEVEKEKRYIVRLKNIRESHETLNCEKHSKIWNFSSEEETILYKTKHTRKELEEAGFGWVFDCEGIEVEEVE